MPNYISHKLIKPNKIESRLYQELIVAKVLDKGNTLVVAPTSLGKTVVAALLIAYQLEKYPEKKILMLSPTKPLAVQHAKSFLDFLEVEEELVQVFTGTTSPEKRQSLWHSSQVISATPQTIENDAVQGKIDFSDVSLIIFDEAHHAVENYAYVSIAEQANMRNKPLILGLTASPGSDKQKIDDVCRNLFIENIEVKTNKDPDVKPYVNEIDLEWMQVDMPKPFWDVKEILKKSLKTMLTSMKYLDLIDSSSPSKYSKTQYLKIQADLRKQLIVDKNNSALYEGIAIMATIMKITHLELLLETQGVNSAWDYLQKMKKEMEKDKAAKSVKKFFALEDMDKVYDIIEEMHSRGFEHPKLGRLTELLQNQFSKNPKSKVIVFIHYRNTSSFVEKYLNEIDGISAVRFIGQATHGKDKGMTQKKQIETIREFREDKYNVLLATSVAEEGLDIPSVDLVIFYEAVPSEIRFIQRRGRTGRHSRGRAIVLLAKGSRDEAFYWSTKSKERKMHSLLTGLKKMKPEKKDESQTTLGSYQPEDSVPEDKDSVLIYVDTREQASQLPKLLKRLGAFIKVKQLDDGDFVLSEDVICERKTASDFVSSLLDGRLFTQLSRLASYKAPVMIIEGTKEELYVVRNVNEKAIDGALYSIMTDYRIPVMFSKGVEDTASIVYEIAVREQLKEKKEVRLQVNKKSYKLPEQQQLIIESLPNVGPNLAKRLLKEFKSIKAIVNSSKIDLKKVESIGEKKAKAIMDVFLKDYEPEDE